jgi:hypothetical protein
MRTESKLKQKKKNTDNILELSEHSSFMSEIEPPKKLEK